MIALPTAPSTVTRPLPVGRARSAGLPAADFSDNARTVLAKRYLVKDAEGAPTETPEDLFCRVATVIAATDRRYGATEQEVHERAVSFYELMVTRRFEPNSPTLMNAGRPLGQLSACFVLPVADALSNGQDGIYDTLRNMALIHQSGGGTGFSFSRLRPRGSMVRSTTGVASGPVSFMKLYDASTDAVKQGGTRRGANMGMLRVDHPDILEFIACKEDLTQVTNFNISVAVTEAFMQAVHAGTSYDLVDPTTGQVTGQEDARAVWDRVIVNAHRTGEPGLIFLNHVNAGNPVPHLGPYEATNPCGEQPLLPYDVCNLGSINVGLYVVPGPDGPAIDWISLGRDVRLATRFLDGVIDANAFPLPEIEALAKRIRRIGIGVMGFADLLIHLGIPYDTAEGVALGRELMAFVDEQAKQSSEELARERGPFPEWARSVWGPDESCARDASGDRIRPMRMLRNCNVTTVAPTGTISIIAGCSSGLEPLFAVAYMRNQAGVMMPDVNADFVAIAQREGWYSEALMERIAKTGSVQQPEVPARWQRVFVTANSIAPEWHVRMQAAFQEHTDAAISKCLAAGTLIPTDRGLIPVEAFAREHAADTFAAPDAEYRTGGHRITAHYTAGEKPATRIRLDNGATLVGATASHRVMTVEGWRRLAELSPGDLVLGRFEESHGSGGAPIGWRDEFRASATRLATPASMTPAFARWLGMVAADGHTTESSGNVGITCKDDAVEAAFRADCVTVFGVEPNVALDRRNGVRQLYLSSRNLARCVRQLIGHGAYAKRAPDAVLRGSAAEKRAFLEGVTLDGFVNGRGLTLYAGMSETLAYHVAALARSFGLPYVTEGRKWVAASQAYAYEVTVSNEMQAALTPVEPHKQAATVERRYKVLADLAEVTTASVGGVRSAAYSALRTARQRDAKTVFHTTARELGIAAETPVFRVTAVEDAGVLPLYDIEVEGVHEYVVNGMVSHNTCNFAHTATVDDVRTIYELAYQLRCKGITIYRDGSRDHQVLSTGATQATQVTPAGAPAAASAPSGETVALTTHRAEVGELRGTIAELEAELGRTKQSLYEAESENLQRRVKRARPDKLRSTSIRKETPLGTMFVHISEDDRGQPFDVFINLGKAGGSAMADAEALGRMVSLALRSGIPLMEIHRQLRGISSDRAVGLGPNKVLSMPDAVGLAIEEWWRDKQGVQQALAMAAPQSSAQSAPQPAPAAAGTVAVAAGAAGADAFGAVFAEEQQRAFIGTCPDCGTGLEFVESCVKCPSASCGFSECG